ncbi:hypothetical protein ACIQ7D_25590 [Streptomyces sp. NPDC096310]|uniref:hypothetical protein n=1 Tax=Streptomyces sp. NPDC096310 TaxID=3366082 RepID=UPI003813C91D
MLTYEDVMTTDFELLTTAAGKFDGMAGEFKKVEDRYKDSVQSVTMGPNWLGASATAAYTNFAATRYEYAAAQKQAKAIAGLLRDAHEQFVDLKKRVASARDDAVKAGMKVSEYGTVSYDYSKLTDSERRAVQHDPDLRSVEQSWAKHIDDCVKAVDDADKGVKLALEAVVVDSVGDKNDETLGTGFNAHAKGDIELYEAENQKEIATRINNGEKVSPAEWTEFQRSFRDNSDNKAFSQTFLNGLGPAGTLQLSNKLNDLSHSGDRGQRSDFKNITQGLSRTLAGATRVPEFKGTDSNGKPTVLPYGTKEYQKAFSEWSKTSDAKFYNEFRDGLTKAGVEKYDLDAAGNKIAIGTGHGQQVRGYQSLVTLMQQGGGYSPQFLGDVTDDMIAAEKKDKDIWDLYGKFEGKEDGWFANDPVDGALKVMSRDPEASTGYLDPAADGNKDRLEYLLRERDWDTVDTTTWSGNIERTGSDTFDGDVRAGLGLALESATTGREPGAPGTEFGRHSEAEARIMHDTINLIDYGDAEGKEGNNERVGKGDELLKGEEYAALRDPLARALASYSPDMVDIITGDAPGGRTGKGDELAAGDASQIQNSRSSLLRLMRGVSEVPDGSEESTNFTLLYQAQQGYVSEQLAGENLSDDKTLENRAGKAGEVFGALTAVGGDLDLGERDTANSEATDKRFYGYHVGGGLITGIPVIGDMAQRTVDIGLNEWQSAVLAEQGLLARENLSNKNDVAQDALDGYFSAWGEEKNLDSASVGAAQREAQQSYNSGRQVAFEALRERK